MKPSNDKKNLTLYIHSQSPISISALKNLKKLSKRKSFKALCTLSIIEIDKKPEVAEQQNILATPLLIIESDNKEKRILGNLSELCSVYQALDLDED